MAFYRFTGTYTNGRTSITLCGTTWHEREPAFSDDPKIANHPEFERIEEPAPVETVASPFKKRGRPRKAH